jgi:hypothetical protein
MADLSLRPQPLLAHWAPGAVVTIIALFYFTDVNGVRLFWRLKSALDTTSVLILLALISFAIGQVFDAFRDGPVEDLLDFVGSRISAGRLWSDILIWFGFVEVRWEFLVTGKPERVEKFEIWFFTHYMLSFNLGMGLLILPLRCWRILGLYQSATPAHLGIVFLVSGALLLYDAMRLRCLIGPLTNDRM